MFDRETVEKMFGSYPEAHCHISERVTRVTVIQWLCPCCGAANENDDKVGNLVPCARCGERITLSGRYNG